jgi:hypothetical protein
VYTAVFIGFGVGDENDSEVSAALNFTKSFLPHRECSSAMALSSDDNIDAKETLRISANIRFVGLSGAASHLPLVEK